MEREKREEPIHGKKILWCERMQDTGIIDRVQYEAYKEAGQS